MSSPALEAFLALLYTDAAVRERFLLDPESEARKAGLPATDAAALGQIDRAGLQMAASSYARKRAQYVRRRGWFRRIMSGIWPRMTALRRGAKTGQENFP